MSVVNYYGSTVYPDHSQSQNTTIRYGEHVMESRSETSQRLVNQLHGNVVDREMVQLMCGLSSIGM